MRRHAAKEKNNENAATYLSLPARSARSYVGVVVIVVVVVVVVVTVVDVDVVVRGSRSVREIAAQTTS